MLKFHLNSGLAEILTNYKDRGNQFKKLAGEYEL